MVSGQSLRPLGPAPGADGVEEYVSEPGAAALRTEVEPVFPDPVRRPHRTQQVARLAGAFTGSCSGPAPA